MLEDAVIFKDLRALQDKYLEEDFMDTQKQQDAYREIAKKYNILESRVRSIAVEYSKNRMQY